MKLIFGQHTADSRLTHPAGGEVLIRLIFLIGQLCITVKYHHMMPTADILSSLDIFERCKVTSNPEETEQLAVKNYDFNK